ncbi:MAG: U32 family peptidase [Deltaproteobacteria bacterium]|nr:U32 family peptidase [Deltaproteobacteria bacterium]
MRAAVKAGADAVYFGLKGHNARARAANFDLDTLPSTMHELHAHGVKGYVALNVLAFDHELSSVEAAIRACAEAGVDAIIVQDLGLVALARAVAPDLQVHASTQMTCSDAAGVELAHAMGASRVVLARELSLDEIARIRATTAVELEVFVHGALCVSYSGQCLTSEAIGGRSANRGACAQACRLPYDLVVDGVVRELGDVAYLLSPQDLEAAALVPQLAALDVQCLKIEGRLKGPEYVAAATRLYRSVVDALDATGRPAGDGDVVVDDTLRREALLTFSRGSDTGFLRGVDHQRLVEGKTCEHRGVQAGVIDGVQRDRHRRSLRVTLQAPLKRGDGVLLEGGRKNAGETGGRIWELFVDGRAVERVDRGPCTLWLGPDTDVDYIEAGRRLFHNDDPVLDRDLLARIERAPARERVDIVVEGDLGAPFLLRGRTARGRTATVRGDAPVSAARSQPLTVDVLRDKLGRLGDTPFVLGELRQALPADSTLPLSSLNRARRALTDALVKAGERRFATTTTTASTLLATAAQALSARPAPPPGLFVLARTLEQARAALAAGADGVWLDFLALTGLSTAIEALRAEHPGRFLGVAPPRIRKPGEEKITKFLAGLDVDGALVRGLGALHELTTMPRGPMTTTRLFVGDFSLNVANRLSAEQVLARGLHAFTPSFDLDEAQLSTLLSSGVGAAAELVVHHPMPLFHTEHCVFAATLSEGRGHDFRTCGRPCEQHAIALRDRVGLDHPVEADVGCRNTVFHAQPQSAASLMPAAQTAGVKRFRIELVRERAADVTGLVQAYRGLLGGTTAPKDVLKQLRTTSGYGVVKGSLRVLDARVPA